MNEYQNINKTFFIVLFAGATQTKKTMITALHKACTMGCDKQFTRTKQSHKMKIYSVTVIDFPCQSGDTYVMIREQ